MKKIKELFLFYMILCLFFLLVAIILVYPVVTMFISSFQEPGSGHFTFHNYIRIFTEYQYVNGFVHSVLLSLLKTVIALAVRCLVVYVVPDFFP